MNQKSILLICPFVRPNIGGVETHLDKLMNFLAKKKIFTYLLAYQPLVTAAEGAEVEKGEYWEIHRLHWFGRGWFNKLENYFPLAFIYLFIGLFFKSLIFYFKNHKKLNCVHAHGFAAAAIACLLTKIHSKRAVISTHAVYNLKERKLLAFFVKRLLFAFDQILAVSETSRNELIAIGLDKSKIKVHPNWVDLDQFVSPGRETAKKSLGLSGKKVVLFVGRLIEKKGVAFLLEAAGKSPEVNFVFIGDGPMEEQIKQAALRQKNIIFVGPLKQVNRKELKKLVEYYSAADLFACIPIYSEGFGAVYLEAVACGTPVLCSNLGSLPTFLDDTVAVLIEPEQKDVEETVRKIFSTENGLKNLQSNCRAYALENFSEKNAQVILDSYAL